MKILGYWDDDVQRELISNYLLADGENSLRLTADRYEFLSLACSDESWTVLFMAITPDIDLAFDHFLEIQKQHPELPIVCACPPSEVYRVVRFMTHGLRTYIVRDTNGDFIFVLRAMLEGAVEAMRAEHERMVSERMREEIDTVRRVQESMIPKNIPVPDGLRICTRYEPSQIRSVGGQAVTTAGGDYYDVFHLDEKNLALLVGDASGHGMKACMSIMTMHTLIRMIHTKRYRDPGEFVAEINNQLVEQSLVNDGGGFITLLYGLYNVDSRELCWTSAGHPPPVLQNLSTGEIGRLGPDEPSGVPLAVVPDWDYDTHVSKLPYSGRLLMYTDGLEEAYPDTPNAEYQEFGFAGIIKTMQESNELGVEQALAELFARSDAFTRGSGRHDDTSSILLEWG